MPRQAPRVRVAVPRVPAAAADPLKLRKAPKVRSVVVDPKASKKAGRPAKAKGDGEGIAPPPSLQQQLLHHQRDYRIR